MKKMILSLFVLLLSFPTITRSVNIHIIENPYQYVLTAEKTMNTGFLRFYYDINRDGTEDLFITTRKYDPQKRYYLFTQHPGKDLHGEYHFGGSYVLSLEAMNIEHQKNKAIIRSYDAQNINQGTFYQYEYSYKRGKSNQKSAITTPEAAFAQLPPFKITIENVNPDFTVFIATI